MANFYVIQNLKVKITGYARTKYYYFMCMGVLPTCLCTRNIMCLRRSEVGIRSLELESQTVVRVHRTWKLNMGPLGEKQVLLTAESSF